MSCPQKCKYYSNIECSLIAEKHYRAMLERKARTLKYTPHIRPKHYSINVRLIHKFLCLWNIALFCKRNFMYINK